MNGNGGPASPSLEVVLDDLCTRFLYNLPHTEYESFERLFFAIESAHWFYDDFYRENHSHLPRLQLKAFAQKLFEHTPYLHSYSRDVDKFVAAFKSYKKEVPTCGAAMLNKQMDKVVLVRGWGSGAKWGFPKGKMAKDETELQAAIREVHEETGFDFSAYADSNPYYVDSFMCGRLNRIFIIPNIPEDTRFETQTRKEISKIDWIPVSSLPDYDKKQSRDKGPQSPSEKTSKNGISSPDYKHIPANKFVHVHPYTGRLKNWIRRERKGRNVPPGKPVAASSIGGSVPRGKEHQHSTSKGSKPNGEAGRVPESSPRSKRNRKNRKRQDNNRDVETFGLSGNGGARALTAEEKDKMFQKYVEEADKRAKELQLGEDDWVCSGRRQFPKSPLLQVERQEQFTFDSSAILAKMHKAVGV